jgi:hypothetical protein
MINNPNLLLAYKRYWNSSINNDNRYLYFANSLLKSIREYDFKDFFSIIELLTNEREKLGEPNTNFKSFYSGTHKEYYFGPYASFWVDPIEYTLRTANTGIDKVDLVIRSRLGFKEDIKPQAIEIHENPNGFYILLQDISQNISFLIDFIEKKYNNKPFCIICRPEVIQELSCHNNFIDYLTNNKKIFGFANIDSSLLKRYNWSNIFLNDQMIDWKSGLNFYTCKYNAKHFLPIFGITKKNQIINLLNLKSLIYSDDDYFRLKDMVKCKCGKSALKFEFLSHHKNYLQKIDLDIANQLTSKYKYFQFIENSNNIDFYYDLIGEMTDNDKTILEQINVVCKHRQVYKVGRKIPSFWRI